MAPEVPDGSGRKGKRSRAGCGTCRARKVKCDERPDGCLNCERLQIPCLRPVAANRSAPVSAVKPEAPGDKFYRHRTFRSCNTCRLAKVRCSGERPECERCCRRKVSCEYGDKEAPRWVKRASSWRPKLPQSRQQSATLSRPSSSPSGSEVGDDEAAENDSDSEETRKSHDTARQPGPVDRPMSDQRMDRTDYPDNLGWLLTPALPKYKRVVRLVELYFKLVHPLRCFGFIHQPSFMQNLEDQSEADRNNNAVLLMICAISAKFYVASTVKSTMASKIYSLRAGSQWAQRAKSLLFMGLNSPTPETIMVTVLLHEHELRIGNYSSAFMITGLAVRLVHGLQLNVEPMSIRPPQDSKVSVDTYVESCRRIMWSVYVMDAWVGSGVDELTMVNEKSVRIRLPSDDVSFILENIPTTTNQMPFLENAMNWPAEVDIDLSGQFVLLLRLRKKVLRFVKHLDETQPPWIEQSEFSVLYRELDSWLRQLPKTLQFDRSSIQKRKISGQHGALMLLQLMYHQTMCDLTRVGMPELFRIRIPLQFPPDKKDFVEQIQNACFDHCLEITKIFREALNHGQEAFADTWLCVVAHDSIRVLAHYLQKSLGSITRHSDSVFRSMVMSGLSTNVQALGRMTALQALAKPLHSSALAHIKAAGIDYTTMTAQAAEASKSLDASNEEIGARAPSPSPHTPEYVLNPLAIYRMARQDIRQHEMLPVKPSISGSEITDELSPETLNMMAATPRMGMQDSTGAGMPEVAEYFNDPVFDAYQLPLGFDDLQVYMNLPPLMNQYTDASLSGNSFAFGESMPTNALGNSGTGYAAGPSAVAPEMQTYSGQNGQMWMG